MKGVMIMKCPECQEENKEDAVYCGYCRNPLEVEHFIFISHAEADEKIVKSFYKMLAKILHPLPSFKYKIFLSSEKGHIKCGDDVKKRIHDELNRSSNLFCILTRTSYKKPWVLYEMGYAQGKSSEKKLIPIAIDISVTTILSKGYPYANLSIAGCNTESLTAILIEFLERVIPNYLKDKEEDKLKKSFAPHIKTFLNAIKRRS